MNVLAIYNMKGGVGKTTTAVNLAYLSALHGYRTLVWDLDPQSAASFYFRIKPKVKGSNRKLVKGKLDLNKIIRGTDFDNLDLLPADFSYRELDLALDDVKNSRQRFVKLTRTLALSYDHLYFDCPPGLSLLSENIFRASDVILIPLIPSTLSIRTYEQVRDFFDQKALKGRQLLPFFSLVDRRKRLHKETCDAYAGGKDDFLKTNIPYASALELMGLRRAPLPSYDRRSRGTMAYRSLWTEVMQATGNID